MRARYPAPMPLRVMVTGGAGFIGSRLTRRLAAEGHAVVVIDTFLPQVHGEAPPIPSDEVLRIDVRDEARLRRAMRGVEVVHHLAAETGVGQSQYDIARYVSVNTLGTAAVLQAAVEAGVGQVVLASSRAVYGEGSYRCRGCDSPVRLLGRDIETMEAGQFDVRCPTCRGTCEYMPTPEEADLAATSVYGLTKVQQEQLAAHVARTHGISLTVLRLFNVFGAGQSLRNPYAGVIGTFFRRLRAGLGLELYEDGQMLRDFVPVNDVVDVFARCTGNEVAFGKTWNVGTGAAVTLEELASTLADAMGVPLRAEISGRYRLGDVRHAVADVARLRHDLGYEPSSDLSSGLKGFVQWALENEQSAPDELAERELRVRNILRAAKT